MSFWYEDMCSLLKLCGKFPFGIIYLLSPAQLYVQLSNGKCLCMQTINKMHNIVANCRWFTSHHPKKVYGGL
jgi:hypothetical protein